MVSAPVGTVVSPPMTVSYCIPLFNKERYIAAVLDAVRAERAATGGDIIVYDDASSDRSAAIAADIIGAEPAARLIRAPSNGGVFRATEILIAAASQPWLRLVDADDVILPGSTAYLLDLLRRHDGVLAHGMVGWQGAATPPDYAAAKIEPEPAPLRKLLRNMDFNLSAALLPAAPARAALPLPALTVSQDLCLTLRLAKRGVVIRSEALVALQPGESANRLSRRLAQMYRDICLILAEECAAGVGAGDAAFAVRRQAGRCRRYFSREAPQTLGAHDHWFLARCRLAHGLEAPPVQAARLGRIARIFDRDAARVLS